MIWMHQDGQSAQRVANHAEGTFWFVLPTLPMFLILPWMLRHGWGFWVGARRELRPHHRVFLADRVRSAPLRDRSDAEMSAGILKNRKIFRRHLPDKACQQPESLLSPPARHLRRFFLHSYLF